MALMLLKLQDSAFDNFNLWIMAIEEYSSGTEIVSVTLLATDVDTHLFTDT